MIIKLSILFSLIFLIKLLIYFKPITSNQNIVIQKIDTKDQTKSYVSQNGNIQTTLSDLDLDLYFEVLYPDDIRFTYRIRIAKGFGSSFTETFKNIPLIPAEPFDACGAILNSDQLRGKVALVIRGDCSFMTKAINVESTGALAAIITDNDPLNDMLIDMIGDDTGREVNIPTVFLTWKDGYMIKKSIDNNRLKYATINLPLNLTLKSDKYRLKKAPWTHW